MPHLHRLLAVGHGHAVREDQSALPAALAALAALAAALMHGVDAEGAGVEADGEEAAVGGPRQPAGPTLLARQVCGQRHIHGHLPRLQVDHVRDAGVAGGGHQGPQRVLGKAPQLGAVGAHQGTHLRRCAALFSQGHLVEVVLQCSQHHAARVPAVDGANAQVLPDLHAPQLLHHALHHPVLHPQAVRVPHTQDAVPAPAEEARRGRAHRVHRAVVGGDHRSQEVVAPHIQLAAVSRAGRVRKGAGADGRWARRDSAVAERAGPTCRSLSP